MQNIDERVMEVVALQKRIDEMTKLILDQLKVNDGGLNTLDKRWRAFTIISKQVKMPCKTYGDGFIDILSDNGSLYDDFYIERYQTMDYVNMYESIQEKLEEGEYNQENVDEWREAVLQSGYGSFIHDW